MTSTPGSWFLRLVLLALLPSFAHASMGGETAKLIAGDPGFQDLFGSSVGISGTTAIAGAPEDDDNGPASGSAYLFNATTGQQLAKLLPVTGSSGDEFGRAVAVSGTTAVVGAPGADGLSSATGAVYLFDTTTGQQVLELVASDGQSSDRFGASVAISGTTVLVGAPYDNDVTALAGSAYLFDATTGQQLAKLLPSDGGIDYEFGTSVAIGGTTALVGAPGGSAQSNTQGYAYLYDTTTGQEIAKLFAGDGELNDRFGTSVAIDGTRALVGAVNDGTPGFGAGSAYVFDVGTGQELMKLVPEDGYIYGRFGVSAGISGTTLLIGAEGDNDNGFQSGSAYLFDLVTGEQIAKLLPSDGMGGDSFGASAALQGTTAVLGASGDDDQGSAYVFDTAQGIAVPYCFGTSALSPCPCGNPGAPGSGCANSAFADGARLRSSGSPCVSQDAFVLRVTSSRPDQPGVFFQGDHALNGGLGIVFGDGLRCAGGNVIRLELTGADGSGAASSTAPIAALGGVSAGDARRYQWWYRDPGGSPCGNQFNLSNGLEVIWGL